MNFLNVVLLIGVVQGVILSLALLVKNYGKKKQNHYFTSLIVLIAIVLWSKLLFNTERYHWFPHIWYFIDSIAYAVGFLWYLTILKSIHPKIKLKTSDYLLLIPTIVHIYTLVKICSLDTESLLSLGRTPLFTYSFYAFCLSVLIVNGGFLFKAYRLIKKYQDRQFPDLLMKGQYALLSIIAIWLFCFIGSFALDANLRINLHAYKYALISLSFLTFGFAFLALVNPASFYFLTQTHDSSETYVLQKTAEKVKQYLQEEQAFLKTQFSLQELANAIDSNPVLTSKAINRILETTFNDLINRYRVQHFIQLATEERAKHLTLWAVAQEAGFGNKVTFYKSFKKLMGVTPKVYLSELEKWS